MSKRDHTGSIKGFYVSREAWYFRPEQVEGAYDDIMVGMYDPEGGTSGEFTIKWGKIGDEEAVMLKVYQDGWSALSECSDLVQAFAALDIEGDFVPAPTREGIKDLLLSLGYTDLTPRSIPNN